MTVADLKGHWSRTSVCGSRTPCTLYRGKADGGGGHDGGGTAERASGTSRHEAKHYKHGHVKDDDDSCGTVAMAVTDPSSAARGAACPYSQLVPQRGLSEGRSESRRCLAAVHGTLLHDVWIRSLFGDRSLCF